MKKIIKILLYIWLIGIVASIIYLFLFFFMGSMIAFIFLMKETGYYQFGIYIIFAGRAFSILVLSAVAYAIINGLFGKKKDGPTKKNRKDTKRSGSIKRKNK